MGARLPQRFIPALKDYSGMGGASGAAGEGKADQGIANLIKPRCSSRAMWLLLILTCAEKSIGDFGGVGSVKGFWSCTGAGDLSAFPGIPAALPWFVVFLQFSCEIPEQFIK